MIDFARSGLDVLDVYNLNDFKFKNLNFFLFLKNYVPKFRKSSNPLSIGVYIYKGIEVLVQEHIT